MSNLLELLHKKGKSRAARKHNIEVNRKLSDLSSKDLDMVCYFMLSY